MHTAIVFAALVAAVSAGGLPHIGLGGIPTPFGTITGVADTPEVSAAKAQHFSAVAAARSGLAPAAGIPTPYGTITNVADTPEVNAAKAQHFAAHAAARGGVVAAGPYGAVVARAVPLAGIPTPFGTITGVADTPEVNAAKAQHFAAHAAARGGVVAVAAPVAVGYAAPAFAHHAVAAPVVAHHGYAAGVVGVAHHGVGLVRAGVPLAGIPTPFGTITGVAKTPEVVAAEANHFVAHAEAHARLG